MARAFYNRDTLARIRALTHVGEGVHAIARSLEWTVQEVRTVAARHTIPVIEDDPAPKRPMKIVSMPEPKPEPEPRKLRRGLAANKMRFDALSEHPRTIQMFMNVSAKAKRLLEEIARREGKTRGDLLSVAIDHALRHGKFEALVAAALDEITGAKA